MNTLTDRYVEAAMRTVPEHQRADLGTELWASIDDQIDARVSDGEEREDAERSVLENLGDPDVLAARYTERPMWLIGPRYFLTWWRLLKVLLWIVTPFAAVGTALGKTLSGAEAGDIIATTWAVTLGVIVHLGFWSALVLAVVERTTKDGETAFAPWSLDQLPEPRESSIKFSDLIASLVFLVIGAGAVLWDQLIGFVPTQPGLAFFDPDLWPWWILALFVIMASDGLLQVAVFLRGRWTTTSAVANAVLNLVYTAPAIWLLTQGSLLNVDFFPTLIADAASAATVTQVIQIGAGFVIAGIAVWDTIEKFIRAHRTRGRFGSFPRFRDEGSDSVDSVTS